MARDQIDMTPLQSRDELVAWLEAGVKPPSEFRIGTEHEKTPFTLSGRQPVPYEGARGIGALWEPGRAAPPAALAALLGPRRASILAALRAPRSTTELARALELSPGSVSQHLGVLRDAGLVSSHRVGRSVLYVRSPVGRQLQGS